MINKVYQLIEKEQFIETFRDIKMDNKVIVRPTYLAICKADQRYFNGERPPEIMKQKLPMALIHEGIGEVVYDPKSEFKIGDKVVMIPNTPNINIEGISSNYVTGKFRGSGFDGFTQEFVDMDRELLLNIGDADDISATMLELLSVCNHGVRTAVKLNDKKKPVFSIIGDGIIGYFTYLILRANFKDSEINLYGRYEEKSKLFKTANIIMDKSNIVKSDFIYECVGGSKQNDALLQAVELGGPEAKLIMMGISENNIDLPIRSIVEKGITIVGRSRSEVIDFEESIKWISDNKFAESVKKMVGETFTIREVKDIQKAFSHDLKNWEKTIMKWEI